MRSRRIQPIARHADQKQEEAARAFVQAQNNLAQAEQQLQQLITYRDDYAAQLVSLSMNITHLRDYQMFIGKINQAMEQARIDIENRKRQCEQKKLAWLKTRSRSKALNMVVEKYQYEEFLIEEKREQKETDEHGSRVTLNKSHSE